MERLVPSSILEEHWALITVLEKWVLDAIGVCNPVWTSRRCCSMRTGSSAS
jgi:hypothetical protein